MTKKFIGRNIFEHILLQRLDTELQRVWKIAGQQVWSCKNMQKLAKKSKNAAKTCKSAQNSAKNLHSCKRLAQTVSGLSGSVLQDLSENEDILKQKK